MSPARECPHCGEALAARARFCRECGSDALTGWGEDAEVGGLDLPEPMEQADYRAFLEREGLAGGRARARRVMWIAVVVVLTTLVLLRLAGVFP